MKFQSRFGETQIFFRDMEKCLQGLVKLVMSSYTLGEMAGGFGETTGYRLGEMSGGFGETSYGHLYWRNVWRVW